jgi:predicted DNA-binding transcriptional regulator
MAPDPVEIMLYHRYCVYVRQRLEKEMNREEAVRFANTLVSNLYKSGCLKRHYVDLGIDSILRG